MTQIQWSMPTPLGNVFIVASDKGLQSLLFEKRDIPMVKSLDENEPAFMVIKRTQKQIDEYFQGTRKEFDIPLDTAGTEFQKKVWGQLLKIPYGKTRSYVEVARSLHQEKASRAVGTANGKNPICIIVPCHRVINANGQLGGYSGGIGIKEKLLELESRNSN